MTGQGIASRLLATDPETLPGGDCGKDGEDDDGQGLGGAKQDAGKKGSRKKMQSGKRRP